MPKNTDIKPYLDKLMIFVGLWFIVLILSMIFRWPAVKVAAPIGIIAIIGYAIYATYKTLKKK